MAEKSLINAQKVEFSYENSNEKIPVLFGVDLEIKKGEFVAILGHNGSGKSTLAKHFNAMLLPSGGSVYIDGIDSKDEGKHFEIRKTVGMVFQNPDNQLVSTIVEEDVAFGPENLGIEPKEIRRRVDEALKCVDMYEYRNHAPHKLSGGQKQRVAIAGIIAMQPQCIVYDEPTAMLDPKGRFEVMETILNLKKTKEIAAVLITHYMEEAAMADRVIVMDKGKILMQGKPHEIFSQVDKLRAHALDVPQAVELADALRKCGVDIPKEVLTPEECAKAIYEKLEAKKCP